MALNIKDPETEKLAAEVAAITGETKAHAVKVALRERRQRLAVRAARPAGVEELRRFMAQGSLAAGPAKGAEQADHATGA